MSDRETPDTELSLPKATIQKITSEILGDKSGVSLNKDARDLLIECCVEFVQLISSEANEIADKEHKKTIAVEHIEQALRDLDFPEYIKPVLAAAGEEKEQKKNRERRTWKAAASGKTDAELEAEQLEMMRQAAEKYNTGHDPATSPT